MLIGICLLVPFFGISQPAERACFSVSGGFYEESPTLEIFPFYQQHHIRFTTNGNRPTAQSRLYTDPLLLDESLYSTSDIYTIQVAPDEQMFYPDSVRHCIVIRAAVFDENDSCISEVATNSYFIQSLGCNTHGLPAVSLCADSLDLFSYYQGIMVPGVWFSPSTPDWSGNYFCKGTEWERACNVEFYEFDNSGINQIAGLRTHGGASRRYQQKGFKVFAKEEYGKKRFEHLFFQENAPLDSYKRLVLKPFRCSNWITTGIQDHLAQQVARNLDIECLASRQAVLFLNGEYWGIYAIEESPDERYLEDHFGVDPDDSNIIKQWILLDHGDDTQWNELFQWVFDADFSLEKNYQLLSEKVDLDNFIDYQIFELYSSNVDWPQNNVRCWQQGNDRWRWIFYDGDGCFFRNWDVFSNAIAQNRVNPSASQSTLFFRKFLENNEFKKNFRNRFKQLMAEQLCYDSISPCFNALCGLIEAEVPSQCDRFGFPANMEKWIEDVSRVDFHLLSLNQKMSESLIRFMDAPVLPGATQSLSCYFNSFQDQLILFIDAVESQQSKVSLFNTLGEEVYTQTVSLHVGSNTISLNVQISSGLYVLVMDNYVTKIIRQ